MQRKHVAFVTSGVLILLALLVFDTLKLFEAPRSYLVVKIGKFFLGTDEKSNEQWVRRLRDEGGYILHFRHFTREREPDTQVFDQVIMSRNLELTSSSFDFFTCLNRIGKAEGEALGALLKLSGIKFSTVISSPLCRARESAVLALKSPDFYWASLIHRTALQPSQHATFASALKKDLDSLVIKPGENIALFGHGGTLSYDKSIIFHDSFLLRYVDERDMGGVAVLERVGDKYIIRHIFFDLWNFTQSLLPFDPARLIAR
jgi:phosphohistidine phosphatase SixA